MKLKKPITSMLTLLLALGVFTGCEGGNAKAPSTTDSGAEKPATWIADRHIVVRTFNDDLAAGPKDVYNNPISKKIKEMTGITWEVQYTSGAGSLEQLTTAFAAGNMPDAIIYYLNNSARKEFPVIRKGALEGVLTDLAPLLKETKVYSKYYDETYMPADSYKNIVQRPEFNGGTYHVPMRVERENGSNQSNMRGGLYIQKSIVDALGIKPWEVQTTEDFYNLLVKIKEGNFKDSFGKPVTPLGPTYWGGANDMPVNAINALGFGGLSDSFAYVGGELKHESETDYPMQQILFVRKLISEGLMHKEALTMEDTRAKEGAHSYSWGIVQSVHSYESLFDSTEYLPFKLNDIDGEYLEYKGGKSQYGAWSVPKTTKKPEEIVKFADFLASKEGKLLWMYGIEGEHYNMENGFPMPTDDMMAKLKDGDRKYFQDLNIYASGGSEWGKVFGETDLDNVADFGELMYGTRKDPSIMEKKNFIAEYGRKERPVTTVYTESFGPLSYIDSFPKGADLRALLDANAYDDIRVKAVFAKTEEEAKKIMDDYVNQLNKLGLQDFKAHIDKIRKDDPKMIFIKQFK